MNVVRGGAAGAAPLVAPATATVLAAADAGAGFLAAGFSSDFLVEADAGALLGAAGFLAGGADFRAAGAAFLAGGAFLVVAGIAFFGAAAATFLVGAAVFFVCVAAFFTTGTAFFFERPGRFAAVAATLARDFLFPARGMDLVADRDAGNLLTWEPLLAGVIVPSFGPLGVAGFPDDDLVPGAGDDTGPRRPGATPWSLCGWRDQWGLGAPEMAAPDALWRFSVGGPSSASGILDESDESDESVESSSSLVARPNAA